MDALILELDEAADQIIIDVPEHLRGKRLKVEVSAIKVPAEELTLEEKRAILAKNKGSLPAAPLTVDEKLAVLHKFKGIFANSTWAPGPEDEMYLQE